MKLLSASFKRIKWFPRLVQDDRFLFEQKAYKRNRCMIYLILPIFSLACGIQLHRLSARAERNTMNIGVFCAESQPNYGYCPKPYRSYTRRNVLCIMFFICCIWHLAFCLQIFSPHMCAHRNLSLLSAREQKHKETM